MKPKVECLGIDPNSVKLALVWEENNYLMMKTFSLYGDSWEHRCAEAFLKIGEFFDKHDVRSVYVEAPVLGVGGPGATIPQAMVTGSILAACGEYLIPFTKLVHNKTWKKRILGNGNLKKTQIATEMKRVWPRASRKAKGDQDLIDASGIYQYGVAYNKLRRKFMRAKLRKAA